MDLGAIRACLIGDGWPIEEMSATTLRSRFRAAGRVLQVFIHVDREFVTLAVVPFAHVPEELDGAEALVQRLLRLNREINFAKFSVDEDGDVVLSVEYRLANLDPSEVRDAVDVLSFYAEKHSAEVQQLAATV